MRYIGSEVLYEQALTVDCYTSSLPTPFFFPLMTGDDASSKMRHRTVVVEGKLTPKNVVKPSIVSYCPSSAISGTPYGPISKGTTLVEYVRAAIESTLVISSMT